MEKKIKKLEQKVAVLEGQAQVQPRNVTIKSSNAKSVIEVASETEKLLSQLAYNLLFD